MTFDLIFDVRNFFLILKPNKIQRYNFMGFPIKDGMYH